MARTFLQQVLHCNYPNSKGLNVWGYAVRKYCSMFLPTNWRQEIMMEVKYFKLSCMQILFSVIRRKQKYSEILPD